MFKNLFATIALSTFISFPAAAQIMKAESPTRTGVNVQADPQGHLYTTPVPGGPAAPVIIQDPTTATSQANVMRPGNIPIPPAGVYAVDTVGFEYCFDGVNWEALTCTGNHGIEVNLNWQSLTAVKISKDANANIVSNPIWCEITNGTAANAQATPIYAAVSKDTSINSVTNPIWLELTNGTAANAQATPLFSAVSKDTSINSVTNPIWLELTNGTAANAQATPVYAAISKDTSANAQGNPIYSAVSKDTSINSVTNPIWLELTNGTAANSQAAPLFSAVSKDTSINSVTNPIWLELTNGTAANAQATPLFSAVSKDTSINSVTNPIWLELTNGTAANSQAAPLFSAVSKDTSINSVTNPIWLELTNGTAANSQAAPLFSAVSKDTSINSVTNPIWLELTNGTAANAQATPVYCAVSKDTSANAQGNPIYAAVSKDTSANAQGNPLYAAISKDTSANAQGNPIYSAISKDTSANGLTNPIYCQLSDGTNAFMTTTSYPGYGRMQDGDSAILADVLDAFADGMATTVNGLVTASVQMRYNGATLDMARSGPNKEDLTYTNNWPDAFDAANARANVYKVGSKEYNPPMEGPTAVVGALIDVLAAKQVINWPNVCVWVKNVGGGHAGPLTDAAVLVSPDNTNWASLTWVDCDGLTSGNTCVYCVNPHSYNWIKVQAKAAADPNDTTVSAWLTSNSN